MKRTCFLLAAWMGFVVPALATVVMTTETTPTLFDLDTTGAYSVTSRSEAVALPYGDGATVTATAPGGAVTTLAAAVNGTNYWTVTAGGLWTLSNSKEGQATFVVRYAGAEQGAGTAGSPWILVDNDELGGLSVTDGFTFTTEGPLASVAGMARPDGYAFLALGDGLYQMILSSNSAAYQTAATAFVLDTEREGPDRRGKKNDLWPAIAYTGDGWERDESAASTLTIAPPAGAASVAAKTGTDTVPFVPDMAGEWTVTLEYGTTVLVSKIMVNGGGTVIFVR